MNNFKVSTDLFDGLITAIEDSTGQFDVFINTDDSSNFFDPLISSRNVLYLHEDMQQFCQMDSCQPKFHFVQQNVREWGNSSDGFTHRRILLSSAIDEIRDLSEFSCEDSLPSVSSCSSQTEVWPVPPVADADVTMTLDSVGVQSTQEMASFQVLIEPGKKIESPSFNVSSSLSSNFLFDLTEANVLLHFSSLMS
jgi:hypothetical protein